MDKKELVKQIVEDLGGDKNINNFSHCSTRLRFDLKDNALVKKNDLQKLKEVMSVVEVAGQTQVVIGSGVVYYYPELESLLNRSGKGKVADSFDPVKEDKGLLSKFIDIVSSLFTPLIDVLIGAGILKGILSIFTALNWMTNSSGTYQVLNAASDSLYYFLPIVLAVTASKRFKTNLYVSITIAGALLYPNLTALYEQGAELTFLGIPFVLTAFKSSVFPIVFAILLLTYVEKLESYILPESIRSRIAPFFP